mmetsp:Transcript_67212/g.186199  ORF Transcript_67212/g.186199 Transcript_67212/m.186199 type:complete len:221 (-) Transcript_67212:158-820(-)
MGADPEVFETEAVTLSASEFYALRLQYELDPALPGMAHYERVPRLVRLLWASEGQPWEVVPPTALRHTFEQPSSFPRVLMPTNDPAPCVSGQVEQVTGLTVGDTGVLVDGSPDHDYNQDIHCMWRLRATDIVRFTFFVNSFELEDSPGCAADRLVLRAGTRTGAQLVGTYCGVQPQGMVLGDVLRMPEMLVDFVTDGAVEHAGFNISYVVREAPLLEGEE